jgi:hypothetical protein
VSHTAIVDLAAWLTRIWDEEERLVFDEHARVHAMTCDGIPSYLDYAELGEIDNCNCGGPALALARIAADRKILAAYQQALSERPPNDPYQEGMVRGWSDGLDLAIRLLASPYKGREGWQEAWE